MQCYRKVWKGILGVMLALCIAFGNPASVMIGNANAETEIYRRTYSQGVQNIVRRAYQMTDIHWTPLKQIRAWASELIYQPGVTYVGLPYGQPINASYVPWKTDLNGFINEVNNLESKMYTSYSSYGGIAPYYSIDCSAFVSWAWGLKSRQTTVSIKEFAVMISKNSYEKIEVGDCLCLSGVHVVLVTDVTYDSNNQVSGIEISEATTNAATGYCCQKTRFGVEGTLPLSEFQTRFFGKGYILYRSRTRDVVQYEHCCAVPLEGDSCEHCNLVSYETVPVTMQIELTEKSILYTAPRVTANVTGVAEKGYVLNVMGYCVDDMGNVWYRTMSQEWIQGENTIIKQYVGSVSITEKSFPSGTLERNVGFSLQGKITSSNPIITVKGEILSGNNVIQESYVELQGAKEYSLKGSVVDQNLTFGTLADGDYVFRIRIVEQVYCVGAYETEEVEYVEESSFCIGNGSCQHVYQKYVINSATCTEYGETKYLCQCGACYVEKTPAAGHQYMVQYIPATCQEYAKLKYTCEVCQKRMERYASEQSARWISGIPNNEYVKNDLLELQTQYRYSVHETQESELSQLEGWNVIEEKWILQSTQVQRYMETPAGFESSNVYYDLFGNRKLTDAETECSRIQVTKEKQQGYIYYHWCKGEYTGGPDNRACTGIKTSDYATFHAFYSEQSPENLSKWDDKYAYANGACCKDTYWYYVSPVYTQEYEIYQKVYNMERWTEWSDWTDEWLEETDMRRREERIVYREFDMHLEDHENENGACVYCGKTEAVQNIQGDVNGDGYVTMEDVELLRYYLTNQAPPGIEKRADINCDGIISTVDIIALRSLLNL